jgi:hypothetical protein
MQVLEIPEISIVSINTKFSKGRDGRLFLNPKYRAFKEELVRSCARIKLPPPYVVVVWLKTFGDIDNCIKVILDALQESGVIEDDKYVELLCIRKTLCKRGSKGSIEVSVSTINTHRQKRT